MLHSLGNFVFDMDFMEQTMQGVTLEATFWGARAQGGPARALPRWTRRPSRPAGSAVQPAARILADVWSNSTGPFAAR